MLRALSWSPSVRTSSARRLRSSIRASIPCLRARTAGTFINKDFKNGVISFSGLNRSLECRVAHHTIHHLGHARLRPAVPASQGCNPSRFSEIIVLCCTYLYSWRSSSELGKDAKSASFSFRMASQFSGSNIRLNEERNRRTNHSNQFWPEVRTRIDHSGRGSFSDFK